MCTAVHQGSAGPPSKRTKVSFAPEAAPKRVGRPTKLVLQPGAVYLPSDLVRSLSGHEQRLHFQNMYGVETTSQNGAWLHKKLTGLH